MSELDLGSISVTKLSDAEFVLVDSKMTKEMFMEKVQQAHNQLVVEFGADFKALELETNNYGSVKSLLTELNTKLETLLASD